MIKIQKTCLRESLSIIWIILTSLLLFFHMMNGFRFPSDYVLTNHIINYSDGYIPRSLIGGIGHFVLGDKWYSWKYPSIIILITGFTFVVWMLILIVRSGNKFNNPALCFILSLYTISPYSRYYLHEMGYYEQYGYILIILLIYIYIYIYIQKQ